MFEFIISVFTLLILFRIIAFIVQNIDVIFGAILALILIVIAFPVSPYVQAWQLKHKQPVMAFLLVLFPTLLYMLAAFIYFYMPRHLWTL